MSLKLSNAQIARKLGFDESDTHQMTSQLREGVYEKRPTVILSGSVEADELYLVAGHKGHPELVKKATQAPPTQIKRAVALLCGLLRVPL